MQAILKYNNDDPLISFDSLIRVFALRSISRFFSTCIAWRHLRNSGRDSSRIHVRAA